MEDVLQKVRTDCGTGNGLLAAAECYMYFMADIESYMYMDPHHTIKE